MTVGRHLCDPTSVLYQFCERRSLLSHGLLPLQLDKALTVPIVTGALVTIADTVL